jgi:hypothetical protein
VRVRLAQYQQTPADKALLLNMAQTCLRLAEQIEGRDLNKPVRKYSWLSGNIKMYQFRSRNFPAGTLGSAKPGR